MLQQHLTIAGPVIYPLLLCSVLAAWLILERLLVLIMYPAVKSRVYTQAFKQSELPNDNADRGLLAGMKILYLQKALSKALRDETVSVYLQTQRQYLFARVRLLSLLAAITPLLGLLGTVLGMITMFQDVAGQAGPVTPALIASGMWEAMGTTAAGLVVAIPALTAAQCFGIWSDHRLAVMEHTLNECSLWLEHEQDINTIEKGFKPCVVNSNVDGQTA
jgi:biopolymer transport protein ExbB